MPGETSVWTLSFLYRQAQPATCWRTLHYTFHLAFPFFSFFFFICACVHRGTEPASNLNLSIWKLADIIPLNFLHQWLLEKPLVVGVKKKKKKKKAPAQGRVLRAMEKTNTHMWYPSSRIPRACISLNEGRREAEAAGGGGRERKRGNRKGRAMRGGRDTGVRSVMRGGKLLQGRGHGGNGFST